MKKKALFFLLGLWRFLFALDARAPLPPVPQELRGVWIATIHNLDWPSANNLSSQQQQQELLQLFDAILALNLNTVFLQVRPAADSFYLSPLEPWSKWLTGREGRAPSPFWDPLEFAISEAQRRGLDLHAWINPYRAGQVQAEFFGPQHLLRKRPDLLRAYGGDFWLDPGDPEARQHIINVATDLVSRYAVNGLHFDDYFYPYPKSGWQFQDSATYRLHAQGVPLAQWRRSNVDQLVAQLSQQLKKIDPALIFGISPAAIWQEDQPAGVSGMSSYHLLYADSRKWWEKGWVDYLAPQFYWPYDDPQRPFAHLIGWWQQQNTLNRVLLAGINLRRNEDGSWVDFDEVSRKVSQRRAIAGQGDVFYSASALLKAPWRDKLLQLYPQPALPPLYSWLNLAPISNVDLQSHRTPEGELQLSWQNKEEQRAKLWVLYVLEQSTWNYYIMPAEVRKLTIPKDDAKHLIQLAISAVNRANQMGKIHFIELNE